MDNPKKIMQITPADGWYYRVDAVNVAVFPVAMWALQDSGEIVGIVDLGSGLQPLHQSPKGRYLQFEQLTPEERLKAAQR
ncbi:hypothetical protein ACTG2W_02375 [Aeromonas sp. 96A]|uniref:methionyl-tRNA formyltransferase n=1 Tax=Aeromonas TaxID=642 RepID=UPI0011B27EE5|nr:MULTISPECIES: methionyl-tRNA formyltransferase [Aeromonas]MCR3972684.1 hypothetical protein [Aeromonas veronii]MCR3977003.1 hypothetical protein [Aeromonas veronii]MDF2415659.1 methionyl-tRNA formyltransferase [Aeromonas sp. 1HA1]